MMMKILQLEILILWRTERWCQMLRAVMEKTLKSLRRKRMRVSTVMTTRAEVNYNTQCCYAHQILLIH